MRLGDELADKGKLQASKGLKANVKLRVFLQEIGKVDTPKKLTVAAWDDFFACVNAAVTNPEVGFIGLAKLVNRANGIEDKK
jgi:hypothetical protein